MECIFFNVILKSNLLGISMKKLLLLGSVFLAACTTGSDRQYELHSLKQPDKVLACYQSSDAQDLARIAYSDPYKKSQAVKVARYIAKDKCVLADKHSIVRTSDSITFDLTNDSTLKFFMPKKTIYRIQSNGQSLWLVPTHDQK